VLQVFFFNIFYHLVSYIIILKYIWLKEDYTLQNGKKYLIELKSHERLNKNVWKKFKNKIIDRNKLPESHQNEIDRLIEYSENITIKYFDHKTWLSNIKKTSKGYKVYTLCSKVVCDLKCKIQINIRTQQTIVSFSKLCDHKISKNNSSSNQEYDSDEEFLQQNNEFSNGKYVFIYYKV